MLVGLLEGDTDGVADGDSLATLVGSAVGDPDGCIEGAALGSFDGAM